jgi:hypothetical protein
MVAVVLIPSFSMAFMMACSMIENGQRVTPAVALTGFRTPVLRELCKVGIVYLGVSLILTLITRFAVQPDFWEQVQAQSTSGTPAVLAGQDVLAMFLIFALDAVALISLCFAAPLTYWQKMPPFKAVFYSFFAVKRAGKAFLIYGLAWVTIGVILPVIVSTLLGVILGSPGFSLFILIPASMIMTVVMYCSFYPTYTHMFGPPPEPLPS